MNCSITYNFVDPVVQETNTIKHFIMEVIQLHVNGRESRFMEQNSATQTLSMLESQFCCHINNSAVVLKVRRLDTYYVTFLPCYRKFLQSHSDMHISFPNSNNVKVFSVGNWIINNEFSSSANNSFV